MPSLTPEETLLLRAEGRAGIYRANLPPTAEELAAMQERDATTEPQTIDVREAIEKVVPLRGAPHLSHVPISIPSLAIEMLPRAECVQAVLDRLEEDREGTLKTIRMLVCNHNGSHISVEDDAPVASKHEHIPAHADELVSA